MEQPTQTLYNLDNEVANWRQNMLNGALTPEDVDELIQHLRDEMSVLQANGLTEEEAWLIARKRIGQPLSINEEFRKVNPDFAASRNLLMLFWGGTIFMVLQSLLFAFPYIIWFIVRTRTHNKLDHFITREQTGLLLYVFCMITVALVVLNLIRTNKISAWFDRLLAKYSGALSLFLVIIGSVIAAINFKIFNSDQLYGRLAIPGHSLEMLGVIFYGSLLFCTAWFTMRFRKQEFRSLKSFSANINWAISLCVGIMIELAVCSTNIIQSTALKYALIALLFLPAGWMAGRSKNYLFNLFMVQLCALYIFCLAYFAAGHSFLTCASEYTAVLVALVTGILISKRNIAKLQTT